MPATKTHSASTPLGLTRASAAPATKVTVMETLAAKTLTTAAEPCQNGSCEDVGPNSYVCTCDDGWTDTNCDEDYNECYAGTHNCHEDVSA